LPGTFAEGLAQTAVHDAVAGSTQIIPSSWFLQNGNELASRFAQGVNLEDTKTGGTHAFTILGRIIADPRFEPKPENAKMVFTTTLRNHGDAIREYVDQWDLTGDLHKKLEELLWTNVLIYGVGGSEKSGDFNADFFHMHFVTSSLLLSSLFSILKRSSQELSYVVISLLV